MARKKVPDPNEGMEMNMTPMIDVVFQLIIFLMLANDLTRKEIEELTLPQALHATEDMGEKEKYRVIVNLVKGKNGGEPKLMVKGNSYNLIEFKQYLRPQAERDREQDSVRASSLYVLIRADKDARWQDVQYVMQACADPEIRVYKLQFATEDPAKFEKTGR